MKGTAFLDGRVTLFAGDCLDVLASLPDNSVDSIVTDPPYHLTSIVKRFGGDGAAEAKEGATGAYKRASAGFMGHKWDAPDEAVIDPGFAFWLAGFIDGEGCFSVHKKTVNGCQTFDCQFSITLRADDADILDHIQKQLGGIGTIAKRPAPKVGNGKPQARYCISSQKDCWQLREVLTAFPLRAKKARDFEIWCQALDAWISHEPGSSWDDVAYFRDALMAVKLYGSNYNPSQLFHYRWARQVLRVLKPGGYLLAFASTRGFGRMSVAIEDAGFTTHPLIAWVFGSGFPKATRIKAEGYDGFRYGGQALKPAIEPIYLGQKPFSEANGTANILLHGTGALNIDGCRVEGEGTVRIQGRAEIGFHGGNYAPGLATGSPTGRWPANLIHDGSDEVLAAFPSSQSTPYRENDPGTALHDGGIKCRTAGGFEDAGSAARFFYSSKADAEDRIGSKHPTVKPIDLMQYLCRLVTPPGGTVLDPFAGTGTTGEAAWREGFKAILIEREPEYQADIAQRMDLATKPTKRAAVAKTKGKLQGAEGTPLFSNSPATSSRPADMAGEGASGQPASSAAIPSEAA